MSPGTTTSAIDTTSANFLVLTIFAYNTAQNGQTSVLKHISDTYGNSWTPVPYLGPTLAAPAPWVWYCGNATVGSGHTVTAYIGGDEGAFE